MPVTGTIVRDALSAVGAVGKQIRSMDELAAGADGALRQAPRGLTAVGAASFLATQAQESDYFRTTREYARNPPYAPWVGRTFDQLTHREAYERFGAWCVSHGLLADPATFTKNPSALEDYRWAWLGGVFYFEWRGLWPIANRGDHLLVSRIVNAGPGWARLGKNWQPHGWDARLKMFDAFRRAGDVLLPTGSTLQEDDVPAPDVWNYPIPDPFTPQNDSMPAFAMLGWATTHAAVARGDAAAAKATAERCERKLDEILAELRAR